jgi:naphtho-gamma-pyrone polyketide synthase
MDYTGGVSSSPFSVYIFGDQTNPFESDLSQLLHVKSCEVLNSFIEQIHYALRLEISRLPASQQACFPRFSTISDLLARKSDSGNNPALELALLCLTQLGRFIKYVQRVYIQRSSVLIPIRYHGDGSRPYPSSSDTIILGLCTGSIAAAAISTSTSVFELIPAAVEAVLIAFRTGLRSIVVRDDIEEVSQDASSVWSVIVGMERNQAIQELENFSTAKVYLSMIFQVSPALLTYLGLLCNFTAIYKCSYYNECNCERSAKDS